MGSADGVAANSFKLRPSVWSWSLGSATSRQMQRDVMGWFRTKKNPPSL